VFQRSVKSGVVLGGAAVFVLALTACSSSSTTTATTKTSATGSAASATGSAAPSSAGQSTSSSDSAASSSSASPSDTQVASAPTATPPAITNKLSDWTQQTGFKLKVDVVTYPYVPPASDSVQPYSNQEFLKLHLELANTGGSGAFSMMDLEVRDSTDTSILPNIVATDQLPAGVKLDLLNLKPGEKQTGELVFIAPKGAKGLRLVFKGTLMTADGKVNTTPPPVIDLGV
jgi:Domain of unknown function (DUF4352)